MTPTEQFIHTLASLKEGDLGLLRTHAGQPLDETLAGFDLFTGIWWPLRQKSQRAPRREVAWLVTKLFAFRPIRQVEGATLAQQCGQIKAADSGASDRRRMRFDELLTLPLDGIEPALQWALLRIDSEDAGLDWVRLTDELSIWERNSTRVRWAKQFLQISA